MESTGQAKAEAQSRAEAARIEGEAAVEQADLKAQAMKIEAQSELERLTQAREAEMKYVKEQNSLEISKAREMTDIETGKFNNMVTAIGADTIKSIATSGPEMQVCTLVLASLRRWLAAVKAKAFKNWMTECYATEKKCVKLFWANYYEYHRHVQTIKFPVFQNFLGVKSCTNYYFKHFCLKN